MSVWSRCGVVWSRKLIDLYTRHGDRLTPAQAAMRGISQDDYATFMMDMADETRQRRRPTSGRHRHCGHPTRLAKSRNASPNTRNSKSVPIRLACEAEWLPDNDAG